MMRTTLTRLLAVMAVSVVAAVSLLTPTVATASTPMTATTTLNVRGGPSTSSPVIGGLYRGQTVVAVAKSGAWTRIVYGPKPAWVASAFLVAGKALPTPDEVNPGVVKTATTAVNLRNGPSLSSKILVVLTQGTRVTSTGKTAKGWTEAIAGRSTGWISSQYLTASASGLPAVTGRRFATAALDVRTTSASDAQTVGEIAKGAAVLLTGAFANGRAQIIYGGAVRWVTAKYLSNAATTQPTAPTLPKVVGTRYVTSDLTIRSSSANTFITIGTIAKGTVVSITGVVQNGRMQIIWDGSARWVTAKYLSTTKPVVPTTNPVNVVGSRGLKPNALKVLAMVEADFPQIRTIYGVRADALPDHPSGRALDLMLPNYNSAAGKALGYKLSRWLQANQASLGINYIIYDQHIWNVRRSGDGWRFMANRGSDTANHKNHVHVTVFAAGLPAI